jgi:hypothetical protein
MFEGASPTWIAVVVASVYLLQNATKDLPVGRWLTPFSLGWIITGLVFIHPLVLKGSWMAMGAAYLLMGVLIVNTLVLSAASKLPEPIVSFKSEGLEKVGLMFTGFVLAGFAVLVKNCFAGLKRLISAKIQHQDRVLASWSNV